MARLDSNFFEGYLNIPNLNEESALSFLESEINRLEPIFFQSVFGYEFQKNMLNNPAAARFKAILEGSEFTDNEGNLQYYDGIDFSLAKFVYYHFIIDNNAVLDGSGYILARNENSIRISPIVKPIGVYNIMIDELEHLRKFFESALFNYNGDNLIFDNFIKINSFGI